MEHSLEEASCNRGMGRSLGREGPRWQVVCELPKQGEWGPSLLEW